MVGEAFRMINTIIEKKIQRKLYDRQYDSGETDHERDQS